MYYDAHNHLHDAWLSPQRAQIVSDLAALPLTAAVVNGTCEADWPDVTALCSSAAQLSTFNTQLRLVPSYGLHPWHVGNASPQWRQTLVTALDASPLVAIGEIGLDRWILDRAKPDDPRLTGLRRAPLDEQLDAFIWQLELAAARNLPVTIHCLDAWGPLLAALRSAPRPSRGFLLHAYGGSAELARDFAELGAYFSFNGYFLGERQAAKRAVFEKIPLDRLLAETDAPAMPLPTSHRTHTLPDLPDGTVVNHPANIAAVYAALANLRGLSVDALAAQLSANFTRLFG